MARSAHRLLLLALPLVLAFAACGGGDDDDDGAGGPSGPGNGSSNATQAGSGSSNKTTGSKDAHVKLKDGGFGEGTMHLEVSGGQDAKLDLKGTGIVINGFTMLNFGTNDASSQITFLGDSKEAPGALSVTTKNFATAAEWGKECTATVDDGAKELKVEFSCKDVKGVSPREAKDFNLKISGNLTLPREQ